MSRGYATEGNSDALRIPKNDIKNGTGHFRHNQPSYNESPVKRTNLEATDLNNVLQAAI